MEKYYALFTCDVLKQKKSMNLTGVFSKEFLINVIKERVEDEEFFFESDVEKIDNLSIHDINTSLQYGYVEELEINQILD